MQRKERIIVLIPAFNEEGKISQVVSKIPKHLVDDILVIDDGSADRTAAEARQAGAKVVSHVKNRGVGAALRTGMDFALERSYDVAVILSGDDQHDPSELPAALRPVLEGGFDFVQGSRNLPGARAENMPWARALYIRFYSLLFRLFTGFPCSDGTNGFRVFRTSILKSGKVNIWQDWLNTYELETYLPYKIVTSGYRSVEVPLSVIYHGNGTSKMIPVLDWWRVLKPLLYLRLSLRR
ncbi:MAG: glycosyltransferase family 2 protein [Candidatus Marsarchaeota archaeon]|nr:glycosyltransferase family 2 protein [Candidatus Marsarchaeota archaeon]